MLRTYFSDLDTVNSRTDAEQLRWSLMHRFLFGETSIAPDIFFFISEHLQRLSLGDTAEAHLFRASIKLGALRPQFRAGAQSFTTALRAIESPENVANRIEGPEIERAKIAAALDPLLEFQSFDDWPTARGVTLRGAYAAMKADIDDVLDRLPQGGDRPSLSYVLKQLMDEAPK